MIFGGGAKYIKSIYYQKKEADKAFDKSIETLVNDYRIEKGLEPYSSLELNSKADPTS